MLSTNNHFSVTTFEQAEKIAERIATSALCPTAFRGKAADVLIAMMMGAEVGLSPMQAIQNIAVINARPSLWGDAMLALIMVHLHYGNHKEWMDGNIKDESAEAHCTITRKGHNPVTRSFSVAQARKAGLWNKGGPWSQYPERMLQMRARAFCIRDTFPDALKGLSIAEEVRDGYSAIEATFEQVEEEKKNMGTPLSLSSQIDINIVYEHLSDINNASTVEDLKESYQRAMKELGSDKNAVAKVIENKNKKYREIQGILHTQMVATIPNGTVGENDV
jgi:hypothetical protein